MNAARFQVRLSGEKADNAEAVGEALSAIGGLFRELGIGVRVAAMGWVCDGCDTARPEDHSDWVHERSFDFCPTCQGDGKMAEALDGKHGDPSRVPLNPTPES